MKTIINYFSRMLCALLLCAGLVATSCAEGPLENDEKTEQGENENTGNEDEGENAGSQDMPEDGGHDVSAATDLSSKESANCYIVSGKGLYKFKTVQGNGNESVGDVASAEVLWESFGTDVTPNVGDLVKNVSYKNGQVTLLTADTFT